MQLEYSIDDSIKSVEVEGNTKFIKGEPVCLSQKFSDITFSQRWYKQGYTVVNTERIFNAEQVKKNIERLSWQMVSGSPKTQNEPECTLEKYHQFVDEELHVENI